MTQADSPMSGSKDAQPQSTLHDIVGFNLRLAHGAVLRNFAERFPDLGLTQKQISILWLAAENGRIGQSAVAAVMQMDRATTTTLVNKLEEAALIRRIANSEDRRKFDLVLTEAGQARLERAKAAIAEQEAWLAARLGKGEAKLLIDLLARIHDGAGDA